LLIGSRPRVQVQAYYLCCTETGGTTSSVTSEIESIVLTSTESSRLTQRMGNKNLDPEVESSGILRYTKCQTSLDRMTNEEMITRLTCLDITKDKILQTCEQFEIGNHAGHFPEYNKWYTSASESDDFHIKYAIRLLRYSQQLRLLRFKMVPSKVPEAKFWAVVFYLMNENDRGEDITRNKGTEVSVNRDKELADLRQRLELANDQIKTLESKLSDSPTASTKTKQTNKKHNGEWKVDKDCEEFLSLEDEMKENLREGKIKRLNEVREQMKFILETDDISRTTGLWECCRQDNYHADGCCENYDHS